METEKETFEYLKYSDYAADNTRIRAYLPKLERAIFLHKIGVPVYDKNGYIWSSAGLKLEHKWTELCLSEVEARDRRE